MTDFSSDKILGLPDNPVKYYGHGKQYPKMIYRGNKIIFIEPKNKTDEQRTCKKATPEN